MLTSTCSGAATFTYTGDSGQNVITASTSGGTLTVTDTVTACNFAESSVTSLTIDGGGGDDTITVNTSVSVANITLKGGSGVDIITGGNGAGNDTIWGGLGTDIIEGNANQDELHGDDPLNDPSDGNDSMYGGSASGGDGVADFLDGGAGNNDVHGFEGEDTYVNFP